MAVMTDSAWDDSEWEICNDNGFVYKRRRRRRTSGEEEEGRPPPPSDDTEAELRPHWRQRRRRCLLSLREKYRREMEQWEALSFTLLDLTTPIPTAATAPPTPAPPPETPGGAFAPSIDDLLSQVESQEAILQKLSEICDFVESICKGQEERLAESLISLPIWGSPRSLIASLSD